MNKNWGKSERPTPTKKKKKKKKIGVGEVERLGWESTTRWASWRIVIHDNSFQSVFIILIVT
jgi:hypothetical protein